MNDKVIEILIHLLGHLRDHDLDMESLNDFSDGLVVRGYDEKEVFEAIGWFLDKINTRDLAASDIVEQDKNSVRVLHSYERLSIPPGVYGYLLKLKSLSVITSAQMERILDHYLLLGNRATGEDDINELVGSVLFDED